MTLAPAPNFTDKISRILFLGVHRIAARARVGAKTQAIASAISVTPVMKRGNQTEVDLKIDMEKAPEALAYEFGSGEHVGEGIQGVQLNKTPGRYKIEPKDSSGKLAFPISRWPNYTPPPNVTWATFPGETSTARRVISPKPYVMHPGVKPEPYIFPAVEAEIDGIMRELANEGARLTLDWVLPRT